MITLQLFMFAALLVFIGSVLEFIIPKASVIAKIFRLVAAVYTVVAVVATAVYGFMRTSVCIGIMSVICALVFVQLTVKVIRQVRSDM